MNLDTLDLHVLSQKGLAQTIVKEVFGWDLSQNNARKYLSGIRRYLDFKQNAGQDGTEWDDLEEITTKADGSVTSKRMILLSEESKKDAARIMFLHGYDPAQWTMIESKQRRNHWQAYSCQDGKLTLHAYESTIRCKPIQTILTTDYIQSVFADLKRTRLPMYTYDHIGKLVVLPIMDLHLGKLGWAKEVGDDYDLDIATALYKKSVLDILAKIKGYGLNIEKFIYPIGQDFYHYDSTTGTTTHGTRMDTDTRWQKMYKRGVELLVWTIELLRTIAPVEVYYTPGNHDEMLSYAATVSVQCYYDKIDAVVVNLSPTRRKYIRYGVGLIGLAHGDKEKTRIEDAMQLEAKEDWGQTVYREMYLGHLHSEHAKEAGGVIYRRIGSITAPDAWHDESAFIGATRRMEAFVWDRETGPELTIKSNVRIEKEEG